MSDRIQIMYDNGCMCVRCPEWFSEPRAAQRKFYKLAAQNRDWGENGQAIDDLQRAIDAALTAAAAEAEKTGKTADKKRRDRFVQAKKDLDEALAKYSPTRKNTKR